MSKVLREITALSDKDCFYIVERYKNEFLFPLHSHEEFELNFIEHGKGVRRVVGDSIEEIGPRRKILSLNSMQSVTKKDIENGMTYVSVMKDNLTVLTEALQ